MIMSKEATTAERCRTVWLMRIQSALRTAVASTIVGCTTLYGPQFVKRHLTTFSAFSYLTAILIVCDGERDCCNHQLGNAIRGFCHAFYATIQVVPLSMLSISFIGVNHFSDRPCVAALAVALMSFVVALPESTPLMTKRIAFGQLVIMFVAAVINAGDGKVQAANWHPVHVAASTSLGAISALLAMLLPYPRLSYCQIRKLCRLYTDGAAERMDLYQQALTTESHALAAHFIAMAKPLAHFDKKLLRTIAFIQDGIVWERPWIRQQQFASPGHRLQALETAMTGMEIALEGTSGTVHITEDMDNLLLEVSKLLNLKARCSTTTSPEFKTTKINLPYDTILSIYHDLPAACFFLSCALQFIDDDSKSNARQTLAMVQDIDKTKLASLGFKEFWKVVLKGRLTFAVKCSLSLGLAVLIGLLFNKSNGYWSGLIVAISIVQGRQALFTVANARAQGTAIGSAYGVIGCFLFKMFPKLRFLALFPWILFTRFLMHSRMYNEAGGTSAVVGALLILGRNNYGLPDEFAIARFTEAIIGLCCFVFIELLFQPTRASTLVKKQLQLSILTLQGCIQQLLLSSTGENQSSASLQAFKDNVKGLNSQVHDLQNFIQEAEVEPCFSFLPFPGSKYEKLHHSLSNMADVLSCMSYSLEYMLQIPQHHNPQWKEIQEQLKMSLEHCRENLHFSLKCLEEIPQVWEEKTCHDQEKGEFQKATPTNTWNNDTEQTTNSGSSDSKEVQESCNDIEDEDELKGKMLISMSSLAFCSSYMTKETKAIKSGTKELIHWEYPSSEGIILSSEP